MMFWLVLILLGLVAAAFVVAPLLLAELPADDDDRQDMNLQLYREHLSDLQADAGADEAVQIELEAQRNLLQDVVEEADQVRQGRAGTRSILIASVLVPIAALLLYADFGAGRGAITDLQLADQLASLDASDREGYEAVTELLAERAARRPEDGELNFFLARTYSAMGQHEKAVETFTRLLTHYPDDPSLASYYAEALFVADNRRITDRVQRAIDAATLLNPHDITLLEIQGIGAINGGQPKEALNWFQQALSAGASGRRADLLRTAISRLHEQLGLDAEADSAGKTDAGRVLNLTVALSEDVNVPADAMVFVYARAVTGPPAPLAVKRVPAGQMPMAISLNESMAMMPGMGLANFDEVIVIARVSLTGDVSPSPGDFEVRSSVIDMNAIPDKIELLIEDRLP